jgi:hypothetical protein
VASTDWLVRREEEAAAASDPENAKLLKCFTHLESYDVYVGVQGERYIVRIIPVPERCIRGEVQLYGGAATYEIHGRDFSILGKAFDQ